MVTVSEKVDKAISRNKLKDKDKLKKQQEYYQRLVRSGVAKKQAYDIKPFSVI
ncbi:MAG: hypothetical protein AB2799_18935 [Candidatus Thiodiazotropha sp.]